MFAVTAFSGTASIASASSASAASAASSLSASTPTMIPHPIDVPTGPQASVASCPNPPELSAPLPPGASISPPSLVPADTSSVSTSTQTKDAVGTCEYTLTLPNVITSVGASPETVTTTWVNYGNEYYIANDTLSDVYFTYMSQTCTTYGAILSAYGSAWAEDELWSGNCNTNALMIWGYVQAANTAEQWALPVQEGTFHHMYQSSEPGSIFFGQFAECMQYPVGGTSYFCTWNNYSPLF